MRRDFCATILRRCFRRALGAALGLTAAIAAGQSPPPPTFNPYALPPANPATAASSAVVPAVATDASAGAASTNATSTLRLGAASGAPVATPTAPVNAPANNSRLEIRPPAAPPIVAPPPQTPPQPLPTASAAPPRPIVAPLPVGAGNRTPPPPPGLLPSTPALRDARYSNTPVTPSPPNLIGPATNSGPAVDIRSDGALTDAAPPSVSPAASPPRQAATVRPPTYIPPPSHGAPLPAIVPSSPIDAATITPLTLEPVDFNGVLLGETTLAEVVQAWGAPKTRTADDDAVRLSFAIEPFAAVEVAFVADKAASMIIELGEQFPPEAVIQELGLDARSAVSVEDETGAALGIVFPERGVSMRYEGDAAEPLVAQIGLDLVSAGPFVLRAERRADDQFAAALADLATALKLDPDDARAHALRAKVLCDVGRGRAALAEVETALKLSPADPECLLLRARLLADEGMYDAALNDTNTVLSAKGVEPLVQAQAWYCRGKLLADGPAGDFEQAIDAHTRAVRLAEPLVRDPRREVRLAAKRLLVEAHLGIAEDVAWGEWQMKETVVPQWLVKAERLAKDAILNDGLSPYVILEVYRRALAAHVGMTTGGDAKLWAGRLQTGVAAALRDCTDPLKRSQMQFDAGLGLYDALQALHARGDIDGALAYGQAAVELVEQGRQGRDEQPIDAYRFGRLYFRIGSLYAVAREDHPRAVSWFDRAAPLLEKPLPEAVAADRGRQGETLVSMGISYWAVGDRERGLALTERGLAFMQQALDSGALEPAALAVPYANLGLMHQRLGNDEEGRRYAQLAARAEPPAFRGTLRR